MRNGFSFFPLNSVLPTDATPCWSTELFNFINYSLDFQSTSGIRSVVGNVRNSRDRSHEVVRTSIFQFVIIFDG
ncbi:MAG: hypothetical protein JWM04_2472 [Verrucomicrobiales bacterium]|nr:hypothetical protein [Verrucomicrobiales bacterium]